MQTIYLINSVFFLTTLITKMAFDNDENLEVSVKMMERDKDENCRDKNYK